MATLESDERNIIEAEEINWRVVVYPILAILILLVGGFGIYYYRLSQREQAEQAASDALIAAKTPEEMVKVADQYPNTTQASIALIKAAGVSFGKKNYDAALKDYQRVVTASYATPGMQDSAQLGVASVQQANGKSDDAIRSYLVIAHKGNRSPFAPVAFHQAAEIYASRKDKANEMQILQQTVSLGGDSPFVKMAAAQLKALAPPAPAASSATNSAPGTNAAPQP